MVKTPRTRHSKSEREPTTIDLSPEEVSRVASGGEEQAAGSATVPDASTDGTDAAATEPAGEAPVSKATAQAAAETSAASQPRPDPASKRPAENGGKQDARATPPAPSSRASALGAGVAGGVVALAAAWLLQYTGLIGVPANAPGEPRMPASVAADLASLKDEIDTLKTSAGATTDLAGITSQVDGLSQALDQVKAEVAAVQQSIEAGGGGEAAGIKALDDKIAGIESRIAAIASGAQGATAEEIGDINQRIADVEALAKSANEAGAAVETRVGALEQSVSTLATKVEAQAGQPKIALAIAASALKATIERGSPFLPEIETFAAIAPDAPGLADLRGYAEKGVATRTEIIAETDAAAKAMIAAANPPSEDADFFERLLSSAESMVTVRPIGAVEGAGVPETVARMEVAVQAGDLSKALDEFETLPEAARTAGAAYADKIKARLTVEQLADQAIAAAMQAS